MSGKALFWSSPASLKAAMLWLWCTVDVRESRMHYSKPSSTIDVLYVDFKISAGCHESNFIVMLSTVEDRLLRKERDTSVIHNNDQ